MIRLYLKLVLIAACLQGGISRLELKDGLSRGLLNKIEAASRKAVEINWRPISIFPEMAKRFH